MIITSVMIFINVKYSVGEINGISMLPNFKDGEYYLLDKRFDEIALNEVYVYKYKDKMICHRVMEKIDDETYIFKGDNNNYYDNPVKKADIECKVVKKVDNKNYLMYIQIMFFEIIMILIGVILFTFEPDELVEKYIFKD